MASWTHINPTLPRSPIPIPSHGTLSHEKWSHHEHANPTKLASSRQRDVIAAANRLNLHPEALIEEAGDSSGSQTIVVNDPPCPHFLASHANIHEAITSFDDSKQNLALPLPATRPHSDNRLSGWSGEFVDGVITESNLSANDCDATDEHQSRSEVRIDQADLSWCELSSRPLTGLTDTLSVDSKCSEFDGYLSEDTLREMSLFADSSPLPKDSVVSVSTEFVKPTRICSPNESGTLHSLGSAQTPKPFLRREKADVLVTTHNMPIPLLTSAFRIPTCFRIAEALHELSADLQHKPLFAIELYAVVLPKIDVSRSDTSLTHALGFADIFFPDKPPYMSGTCGSTWIDQDQQKRTELTVTKGLVRAIIQPHTFLRSQSGFKCANKNPAHSEFSTNSRINAGILAHVHIEKIQPSSWDEIDYIRGIVDPEF